MTQPPAPPLPTGPHWRSGPRSDESEVHTQVHGHQKRAAHAEKRLKNALRELKRRGENVAVEVRAARPALRIAAIALSAGIGAVCLVAALRWAMRSGEDRPARRSRKRRSGVPVVVARSLTGELMARLALGAAGVIGARIASDLVAPALSRALTDGRKRGRKAAAADDEEDVTDAEESDDSEE